MRLHRLELTAFGPFAGTQRVDFDELSSAGLFLLHGPTGAGKTSVLDAVCYALYGQVPGARPATRLRSDHAAAGTATEVVLELTLGGRRLEITRRPEQLRAKKRGTGTTLDKAVTLLREHKGGQWEGISKSHQEIGEEIKQLVGMSCEQFCQVVLLPQGEFATFLRASATERAALLGKLFDTRRFRGVERWLRDRKQEASQRLGQGDADLRDLAARLRQAAGPGPGPEAEADLLEWAAVLRCDAREARTVARSALHHAETAHRAAADSFDAARDLHALQTRHADLCRRADALAAEDAARTAARTALTRALRATTVEPALAHRDKAATQHRDALTTERRIAAELTASGEQLPEGALPQARTGTRPARGETTAPEPSPDPLRAVRMRPRLLPGCPGTRAGCVVRRGSRGGRTRPAGSSPRRVRAVRMRPWPLRGCPGTRPGCVMRRAVLPASRSRSGRARSRALPGCPRPGVQAGRPSGWPCPGRLGRSGSGGQRRRVGLSRRPRPGSVACRPLPPVPGSRTRRLM